jgi:hypothetical protein
MATVASTTAAFAATRSYLLSPFRIEFRRQMPRSFACAGESRAQPLRVGLRCRPPARLEDFLDKMEILDAVDVMAVFVDGAIPIENQRLFHG